MKFRHLEYFVTAAEELNFTHAAYFVVVLLNGNVDPRVEKHL
jgi:hypothetical protein